MNSFSSAPPTTKGAVVSELTLASDVGAAMLRQGGSAADALIAATLVVGTCCSWHSGIAGGGFALVKEPGKYGAIKSLDFRVEAPAAAKMEDYQKNPTATTFGGLSVAVPGELKGLEELHKAYGELPWATLIQPSIDLARDGFPATQDLLRVLRTKTISPPSAADDPSRDHLSWIHGYPPLAALFAPSGSFLAVGDLIKRPAFADALEVIAREGASALYEGELAQGIVDCVCENGGNLSLDDLKNYRVRHNTPLSIEYKGRRVHSTPAPASGAVLLLALSVLSNLPSSGAGSVEDAHRLTEALRFAYANRTDLGDPAFIPGLEEKQASFVKPETGKAYAAAISDEHTLDVDAYNPSRFEIKEDHGTSHLVAADASGLVISMTTTITLWWGSRLVVPSSGIVLSDGMEDLSVAGAANYFGYEPSPANYIAPGRRPLSSQCPFLVESAEGEFEFAGGAAGGSRILSSNVQTARNYLEYGLLPTDCLDAPRLHNQLLPNETHLEGRHLAELEAGLLAKGHKIVRLPNAASVGCCIGKGKEDGRFRVGSEPRIFNGGGVVVE